MQPDYHIEDLVHQTGKLVVYRVTTRDQIPLALVRLRYDDEILTKLRGGVFEAALAQLMQLNHSCLRSVVNGGLDPVDGYPWVAARWWDGVILTDRVRGQDLTEEELLRIQGYSKTLINALGPIAGTIALTPGSIVTCGEGEQTIDTFSIDYHSWFAAFAHGIHPADLVDIHAKYKALTTYLRRQAGLTSTSLLTSLEALPSQPEQSIALPSAAKPSPLKILLILILLLGAIGYFGWKLGVLEPGSEETPNTLESAPTSPHSLKYYTIDDEPQIRKQLTKAGQIISVRAVVQEVTKSQSGKTFHLQFKPAPPEFTGRIEKSKAEASLDETYLKSLIGKMIEIKGRARKSADSSRLSIVLTNQSQISLIE